MDKFEKLDYDAKWLIFFVRYRGSIDITETQDIDESGQVHYGLNFEPYFDQFCSATKNSMQFDDYDAKMRKLSRIAKDLIKQGIVQVDKKDKALYSMSISNRGKAYFELEIENKIISVLPNIDLDQEWSKFMMTKDGAGIQLHDYEINPGKDSKKTDILKKLLKMLQNTTRATMISLPGYVMQDPDLTKNIIEFISKLFSI